MRARTGPAGWAVLALGLAFLYLPIVVVAAYSFNASRLVTVWGGFSLKWYGAVLRNTALLDALGISLGAAAISATLATGLGLCAALGLARPSGLPVRGLFSVSVHAPLVVPDVLLGLSLLLLFVALGIERGFWTVVIAHATLGMAFVAVTVRARLVGVDPSLEEAARDLGAGPLTAFATVTLPLIAPALAAGWLLAFSLSLDDLVLASFAAGPGSTTLPMRLYSQVRLGVSPEINAVSTVLTAAAALTASVYAATFHRKWKFAP
jgi:putrescine transport system permease protein